MEDEPAYFTQSGDLIRLTWTRLKTPAEVDASIPEAPLSPVASGVYARGPGELVSTTVVGEGLDRQRVEMRRWKETDDPNHPLRSGFDLWPPAPGTEPRPVVAQRSWAPGDINDLAEASRDILLRHDYPLHLTHPRAALWSWIGDDLCWTEKPDSPGWLSNHDPEDPTAALGYKPWMAFRLSDRFRSVWPRWSSFEWAEMVHRQIARRSSWLDELPAVSRSAASTLWEDGFAFGAYLTEEAIRRRHHADLIRGERNAAATNAGALLTIEKRQRERRVNMTHALDLARVRLQTPPPTGWAVWTLGVLAEEVSAAWKLDGKKPQASTIKTYLKEAKATGEVPELTTVR